MESNNDITSATHDTSSNNNTTHGTWSPTEYFPVKYRDSSREPEPELEPYVKKVDKKAKTARPDLRFLAKELERLRSLKTPEKGKVAVLKFFDKSASPEIDPSIGADRTKLEKDLKDSETDGACRLYILEDISNECVEIFGSQLRPLDPSFFARHLRVTRWESSSYASNAPPLPSSTIGDVRSFLLCYPELVIFPGLPVLPKDEIELKRCYFCDCHLYREITFTRLPVQDFRRDNIGVIRRKLSFWSWTRNKRAWVGEL